MKNPKLCPVCHGFGVVMGRDFETKPCWKCNGSGEIEMNTQDIRKVLFQIEELAGESQQLWDNAWTNAVVADHPDKAMWTRQTYRATRLHSNCMDLLRSLSDALQVEAEAKADELTVDQKASAFVAEVKLGRIRWPR